MLDFEEKKDGDDGRNHDHSRDRDSDREYDGGRDNARHHDSDCEYNSGCGNDMVQDRDCATCRPGHPMPQPILFECGNGGGFTFSADDDGREESAACICTPKTVANVTVDTTFLRRPKIKVEFSSIITFVPGFVGHARLEFDLVRCCRDFPECAVGTWNYEVEDHEHVTKSFCFDYCDCNSCPGCCLYIVRVRPVFVKDATICVTNTQIAVFAQGH